MGSVASSVTLLMSWLASNQGTNTSPRGTSFTCQSDSWDFGLGAGFYLDASQPAAWWDGRPFDAILLDAPCSASGIVRRHPDIRWLRRPGDIDALARTQGQMLDALWPLLAPGGRLLYATCSVFRCEGQAVIDAFLQRLGPGRALLDPASPGHLLPLPDNEPAGASSADGFFYALLHKESSPR